MANHDIKAYLVRVGTGAVVGSLAAAVYLIGDGHIYQKR